MRTVKTPWSNVFSWYIVEEIRQKILDIFFFSWKKCHKDEKFYEKGLCGSIRMVSQWCNKVSAEMVFPLWGYSFKMAVDISTIFKWTTRCWSIWHSVNKYESFLPLSHYNFFTNFFHSFKNLSYLTSKVLCNLKTWKIHEKHKTRKEYLSILR
jgi:hypothetical protein